MKLTDLIEAKRAEVKTIIDAHDGHTARQRALITNARSEGRDRLTPMEQSDFDIAREGARIAEKRHEAARRSLDELERAQADEDQIAADRAVTTPTGAGESGTERAATIQIGREERTADSDRPAAGSWVRSQDGLPATVQQRFADHPVVRAHADRNSGAESAVVGQHGSLGQLVRSMSTTSGSAVVPTTWAGDIIDRARNYAAVLQAGAQIVPMDAKTVQIGRLTADPTAAFRTEGSTITASDPTFDNVTLTATTMSALVVGSMEWFQDSDNVDQVVSEAIAKAIGLQLDLVGLFGGLTTGNEGFTLTSPPNPRGVLPALQAVASTSVLGGATNGTAQTATTYYNEVLDTIFTVRDYNEAPTGIIWNSKLARQYAKAYDTTGQPLALPADVAAVPRYVSNQIPSFTAGTMTSRATDLFVGDWSQLLIGQRLGLTIQTLTERYAENGQVGIVAHWRGDVQPARPRAFAVYRYLQGA